MPRKFKADYEGVDWVGATNIVIEIQRQLGGFSYMEGVLRGAERDESVTLTRGQWAAILDHVRRLTPKRDITESMMRPSRSYWAVMDQLEREQRNGNTISVNEAERRAGLRLGVKFPTVKRHYNETRKLLRKHGY